jgi:hypothetical protein
MKAGLRVQWANSLRKLLLTTTKSTITIFLSQISLLISACLIIEEGISMIPLPLCEETHSIG